MALVIETLCLPGGQAQRAGAGRRTGHSGGRSVGCPGAERRNGTGLGARGSRGLGSGPFCPVSLVSLLGARGPAAQEGRFVFAELSRPGWCALETSAVSYLIYFVT